MRRAFAALAASVAVGLCVVGFLRHRPRRVRLLGGFRCERCGRASDAMDDLGEQGYVPHTRRQFTRVGASGRAETTRSEGWPS